MRKIGNCKIVRSQTPEEMNVILFEHCSMGEWEPLGPACCSMCFNGVDLDVEFVMTLVRYEDSEDSEGS